MRGEVDYTWRGNCRVSNTCSDDGCRGEDVTKIAALSGRIPGPTAVPAPDAVARVPSPGDDFWVLLEEARGGFSQ